MTPFGPGNAPPSRAAYVVLGLLFLLASGAQSAFSAHLSFLGAQPDFLLTLTLAAALLSDPWVGSLVGMTGGLLSAATVGQTVGTFLVSRTIAGYVAGQLTTRLYRGNIGVIFLGVFVTSLLAEVLYGLAAPRGTLRHWALAVVIGAAMNAVLALPLTLLLRRCGWGRNRL